MRMFHPRARGEHGPGGASAVLDVQEGYTYPVGTLVRVAERATLEAFAKTWRWHHPLQPEQFAYANRVARVERAGLYHGGDELYELENIPGYWHPACLETSPAEPAAIGWKVSRPQ